MYPDTGKNQQNIHGNLKINWAKLFSEYIPGKSKGLIRSIRDVSTIFVAGVRYSGGCRSPLTSYRASLSLRRYCRETVFFAGYPFIVIQYC